MVFVRVRKCYIAFFNW